MRRPLLVTAVLAVATAAAIASYEVIRDRDYRALLAQGDAALRADQSVAAVEAYSGAAALRPDSMLPRLRRGEAYQRRGDLDAAVRDFRDAAALDASATRPREELGDVLYALRRYARAADAYASALTLDDRLTRVEYKRGLALYRAGDARGAVTVLAKPSQSADATAEVFYVLGLALRDLGRSADAQRALEKAIAMSPGFTAAREELADFYRDEHRRSDAVAELQVLAGLQRDRVERQINVARTQAAAGRIEPAIVTLGAALEQAPDNTRVYEALGEVWLQDAESRGDAVALNKALQALERAAGANASSHTLTLFGRALLRRGQVDRAEQTLQLATTRYPVDPGAFYHYALAAERQKHLEAARQALIDYSALQGDDDHATETAARIASLSMRLGDPATAAAWLTHAVAASGAAASDPALLAALATAQQQAGLTVSRRPARRGAGASGR